MAISPLPWCKVLRQGSRRTTPSVSSLQEQARVHYGVSCIGPRGGRTYKTVQNRWLSGYGESVTLSSGELEGKWGKAGPYLTALARTG